MRGASWRVEDRVRVQRTVGGRTVGRHGGAAALAAGRLVALGLVGAGLVGAGCSFLLDLDPIEGHPCAVDGGPACLPGYACIDGICQRAGDGVKTCPAECPAGQKCDLRVGKCADLCAASVCETGQGCHAGEACAPIGSGVGRSCSVDSDCAGAIPGCSTDPAAPAAVHCVCAVPLSGATGLCLGIPAVAQDCAACGEAACIPVPFSGAGPGVVCAPGGFRGCEGPVDCADPETDLECTLFAWPGDPGWRQPGEPEGGVQALGYFSACASKGEAAEKAVGEGCDPALLTCRTGLCLLDGTGAGLCTRACGADGACAGVSEGRCVAAPVASVLDGRQTFDVARVCGAGPTLGAACDADPGVCGNDAPLCAPHPDLGSKYCTRACVDDGDCDAARGFRCRPGVWQCF